MTEAIIRGINGGLSRLETAKCVGISERTLYNWIRQGKSVYILTITGEIDKTDLPHHLCDMLDLYEALYSVDDPQCIFNRIAEQIAAKDAHKYDKAEERAKQKRLYAARERERNRLRGVRLSIDRDIKRQETYMQKLNYLETLHAARILSKLHLSSQKNK